MSFKSILAKLIDPIGISMTGLPSKLDPEYEPPIDLGDDGRKIAQMAALAIASFFTFGGAAAAGGGAAAAAGGGTAAAAGTGTAVAAGSGAGAVGAGAGSVGAGLGTTAGGMFGAGTAGGAGLASTANAFAASSVPSLTGGAIGGGTSMFSNFLTGMGSIGQGAGAALGQNGSLVSGGGSVWGDIAQVAFKALGNMPSSTAPPVEAPPTADKNVFNTSMRAAPTALMPQAQLPTINPNAPDTRNGTIASTAQGVPTVPLLGGRRLLG